MNLAIKVEDIGKKYIIKSNLHYNTLRSKINDIIRRKKNWHGLSYEKQKDFWALKDINFNVEKGRILGIIGPNGAGKSTLLKLLSRISPPTTGKIKLCGRIATLLEVGTGFHPELTGRENVFLNGAILGMSRFEINKKFSEIIEFSGVGKFLDTPVKYYSSGMKVRLAFSVAAFLEQEILLVDEVLAVGDLEFQKKCLGKMDEVVKKSGRTIVFVSHNMSAINNLCDKVILLESGRIKKIGKTDEVIEKYIVSNLSQSSESVINRKDRKGKGDIYFTDIIIVNQNGTELIKSGDKIKIVMEYYSKFNEEIANIYAAILLLNNSLSPVLKLTTSLTKYSVKTIAPKGKLICQTESLNLKPGFYTLNIAIFKDNIKQDHVINAARFEIIGNNDLYNFRDNLFSEMESTIVPHSFTNISN